MKHTNFMYIINGQIAMYQNSNEGSQFSSKKKKKKKLAQNHFDFMPFGQNK